MLINIRELLDQLFKDLKNSKSCSQSERALMCAREEYRKIKNKADVSQSELIALYLGAIVYALDEEEIKYHCSNPKAREIIIHAPGLRQFVDYAQCSDKNITEFDWINQQTIAQFKAVGKYRLTELAAMREYQRDTDKEQMGYFSSNCADLDFICYSLHNEQMCSSVKTLFHFCITNPDNLELATIEIPDKERLVEPSQKLANSAGPALKFQPKTRSFKSDQTPNISNKSTPEHSRQHRQESSKLNTSMQVLGLFSAVLGAGAVAIAFTLLTPPGLMLVAGVGISAILLGVGLFSYNTYRKCQSANEDRSYLVTNDSLAAI